jgi:hypothetical protein
MLHPNISLQAESPLCERIIHFKLVILESIPTTPNILSQLFRVWHNDYGGGQDVYGAQILFCAKCAH